MSDELPQGNRKDNCGKTCLLPLFYFFIVCFPLIFVMAINLEVWDKKFDELDIQALL
jgi:hypothetical protein